MRKAKKNPRIILGFYETPKDTDREAKLFKLPLFLTIWNPAAAGGGLF
jgi:hypothetical protein